MKQNTKFIGIYAAILFSFALILILFAGLTQNKTDAELKEQVSKNKGIQTSLTGLTNENQSLQQTIANLQAQNQALVAENQNILNEKEAAVVAYGGDVEVTRKLLEARMQKLAGHIDAANEILAQLYPETMTEAQLYLYQNIAQ